jgi:hypothetical protein
MSQQFRNYMSLPCRFFLFDHPRPKRSKPKLQTITPASHSPKMPLTDMDNPMASHGTTMNHLSAHLSDRSSPWAFRDDRPHVLPIGIKKQLIACR